jgi:hypothetical protein
MLFNQQLPAVVLVTWIQLRALAWRGWSTPAFSLAEIASILGVHPSRLEKHLDYLQYTGALSLRVSLGGKIVLSFPDQPAFTQDEPAQSLHHPTPSISLAEQRTINELAAYFPSQILGYLSYTEETPPPADTDNTSQNHSELGTHWIELSRTHSLCSRQAA